MTPRFNAATRSYRTARKRSPTARHRHRISEGGNHVKGVHTIAGREFMLCGRYTSRGRADYVADSLLREWEQTRVRKTPHRFGDWSVWVHGKRNGVGMLVETIREATRV